ncbi:hypothetical protein [Streptomyces sp. NPDC015130]|uniref:hypothetical protein n=1 Tax=Streptomyces sp. NPDC015130 TaxID=3364940 RepID=UPI0036F4F241
MSRTAIDTDPNGEQPPPEDDHAFLRPIRCAAGRRHPPGRKHAAEFPPAPAPRLRRTMHPVH